MLNKIGRNDLCPCGSGIKYKKCCLSKRELERTLVDPAWQQLRSTEGNLIQNHLEPFLFDTLPKCLVEAAKADFYPDNLPEFYENELVFLNFFIPWALFNWIPENDFDIADFNPRITLAQNFLTYFGIQLNNKEKRFITAMNKTYYSFYQIVQVELNYQLTVKDLLLDTTHIVKEQQGTHYLKRGDIVFSRILTDNYQSIFIGMAPLSIPSFYVHDIFEFKQTLLKEHAVQQLNTTLLLKHDLANYVLFFFFDIAKELYNPGSIQFQNTDNELLQFCHTSFTLTNISPETALKQLMPLTLSNDPNEFLQAAVRDKAGDISTIQLKWLKTGNKQNQQAETTVLGDITIEADRLLLETNSQERAEQGKKLLLHYLGGSLCFQETVIESPEEKVEASVIQALFQNSSKADFSLAMPAPLQAYLKELTDAHWKNWFDEPIPMLGGKTPREAAKTADGREQLEGLLLDYEHCDQTFFKDDFKVDISYLRRELALNK